MQTNRQAQAHQMLAIVKRRDAVSGAMFRFGFSTSLFVLFFFLFYLFIYFFDKQTGKRKDKGGRLHKDSPIMWSFSQSIWSLGEGKGEFF